MLRNRGAALALVALLALGGYAGFLSISSVPQTVSQPSRADEKNNKPDGAVNKNPTFFFRVWGWAETNDKPILALTAIGALTAASVLTYVTAGLWRATRKLADATVELGTAEHEQAVEIRGANEIAERAFDLAQKQFLLAGMQCDLAEKQHAIDFLRFHATNRPKLRIRHVWIREDIQPNKPITVNIIYVNVGDTKAQVLSFGVDFNILWPGVRLPGNLTPPMRPGVTLPECGLGETQSTGDVMTLALMDAPRVEGIRDGFRTLCCFGFIEYSDIGPEQTRKVRRTAFCRMFVPTQDPIEGIGRFERPSEPDPDYEYED
jgi:hypothetical protein